MKKLYIMFLFISLLFLGCNEDNGTEPVEAPSHDENLVGNWALSASKLNGVAANHQNFENCCVNFQFDEVGTGIAWKENYGVACGCTSFLWSTKGDQLTIHEEGEYPFVSTYSVSNGSLTISYVESGAVEMIYSKR